MVFGQVLMAIPVAPRNSIISAAPDLDEPHAAFEEPARNEAALAEIFGGLLIQTVEFAGSLGFAGDIKHLGSAQLQFSGQLIGSNTGVQPRVARARSQMRSIQLLEQPVGFGFAFGSDKWR